MCAVAVPSPRSSPPRDACELDSASASPEPPSQPRAFGNSPPVPAWSCPGMQGGRQGALLAAAPILLSCTPLALTFPVALPCPPALSSPCCRPQALLPLPWLPPGWAAALPPSGGRDLPHLHSSTDSICHVEAGGCCPPGLGTTASAAGRGALLSSLRFAALGLHGERRKELSPHALHSLEQAETECREGAERCSLAPAPSPSPLACLKAIGGPGPGSVAPACSCCLASPHQPAGPAVAPCCCARALAPATLGPGLLLSRHEPPRQLWATGGGSGDCSGYCFLKTWLYLLF